MVFGRTIPRITQAIDAPLRISDPLRKGFSPANRDGVFLKLSKMLFSIFAAVVSSHVGDPNILEGI